VSGLTRPLQIWRFDFQLAMIHFMIRVTRAAIRISIPLSLFLIPVIGNAALAASIPHGTVELVAENSWIAPGQSSTLGLHFKMERGWHIYWVNPGDSGEPPRIAWQLPRGVTAGEIQWPAPHKMGASTIVNYVYDGDVVLLIPLRAAISLAPTSQAKLGAMVRFLICSDQMCVPGKAQLSVELPVKSQPPATDGSLLAMFAAARSRLPQSAPAKWKVSAREGKDSIVIDLAAGHGISQSYFYPLAESQIDNAAPQGFLATASGARITLHKSDQLVNHISRLKGVLVLESGEAYTLDVPVVVGSGKS
jgi:DsbC/DsbD-like thiol-disulfide interchange protein